MPITFVYRSHYQGPLSKLVRTLEDDSVLAWFQRVWPVAKASTSPSKVIERQLGVSVYGMGSLFEAAREQDLPAPRSRKALQTMLEKHLYVEGGVRLDAHSLRALTDDDEVMLAYFFFDEKAAQPERVAYLLHDTFPLPTAVTSKKAKFECPVETTTLSPGGSGPGRTWAVLLTFYDSDSFPCQPPSVFEGVRVPELLSHLRAVEPPGGKPGEKFPETWPLELRLLRAAIGPKDSSLLAAAQRAAAYPLSIVGAGAHSGRAGLGPQKDGWARFEKLVSGSKHGGDPAKSLVDVSEHIVQIASHQSEFFGYQQWFLFDDIWAGSHPTLAASLLRYAAGWDPWTDDDEPPSSG